MGLSNNPVYAPPFERPFRMLIALGSGYPRIRPIDDQFPLHEIPAIFLAKELIVVPDSKRLAFALVFLLCKLVDQTIGLADRTISLDHRITLPIHMERDRE
jgi:hypothetical protein